ncbi:4Fe-4S binding protein [Desulfovibrio sp. OttesenSCG-928-I05]|nr:4Fe-4S binding protein [Desulfovibrio sp. OttesenSCG-928-I05]
MRLKDKETSGGGSAPPASANPGSPRGGRRRERKPAAPATPPGIPLRRLVQTASVLLFVWLLLGAVTGVVPAPSCGGFPALDVWIGLDPLTAIAASVASRAWLLLPGLLAIVTALFAGRVFCGYICPMGAILDAVQAVQNKVAGKRRSAFASSPGKDRLWRQGKYWVLAFMLGAALGGTNLSFWAAPLPLVTRLCALLVYPFQLAAAALGLAPSPSLFWHRGLSTSDIALGCAMLEKSEKMGIGQTLRFR